MPIESSITTITSIPDQELPDLHGNRINLLKYTKGNVSVVFFSCNHCPYVQWVEPTVRELSRQFTEVRWLAICSNDIDSYPEDDICGLKEQVQRSGWSFPYLVDSRQSVAHMFGAVCTPDFYVFDRAGQLTYRGAIDASRPNSSATRSGEFLQGALASAFLGQVFQGGSNSLGCGIKWLTPDSP